MSWFDRLARKREIQGEASRGDMLAAIELNALNLEDTAAIRGMVETEGWEMYSSQLKKDLSNKQKTIEELSIDPEVNKFKLTYYGATCALIRRQLAFVDGVLKREDSLMKEQNRLRVIPEP